MDDKEIEEKIEEIKKKSKRCKISGKWDWDCDPEHDH